MLVLASFVNKGCCLECPESLLAVEVGFEPGPLERCFAEGASSNSGKSSLVSLTCELLDPFGGHELVKSSSASIFCSLVLVDFQLCFSFVKNIWMDGSN